MDERIESAQSERSYDGKLDQVHRALRRKQHLLQKLREQHILEELHRPHTWAGQKKSHFVIAPPQQPTPFPLYQPVSVLPSLPPPQPALPQPPRIFQQTLPQQPTTIIQQMPQQQPLITQIPPAQPYPTPHSGSIKEDMVELMLMQNAQMHQIIMHNMMLKAMPPMVMSPLGGTSCCTPPITYQDSYLTSFGVPHVKPRGSAVHHHHHYGPSPAVSQLPPISNPTWLPGLQAGGHLPSIHHVNVPLTLPPLNG